jgi:hypothetical protein
LLLLRAASAAAAARVEPVWVFARKCTVQGANVSTEFWSFAGAQPFNPANEPFLVWLQTAANMSDADLPKVSTSLLSLQSK